MGRQPRQRAPPRLVRLPRPRHHLLRHLFRPPDTDRGGGRRRRDHHRDRLHHRNAQVFRLPGHVGQLGQGERGDPADHRLFPALGPSPCHSRRPAGLRRRGHLRQLRAVGPHLDDGPDLDRGGLRDGDDPQHRDPRSDPLSAGARDRDERDPVLRHDDHGAGRWVHHAAAGPEPLCRLGHHRRIHPEDRGLGAALRALYAIGHAADRLRAGDFDQSPSLTSTDRTRMPREYLKKATLTAASGASDVRATVQDILDDIERGGDSKALEYAAKFDGYDGAILLTEGDIAAAAERVPGKVKDDIRFAHDNVRRFAEAQKATLADVEVEIVEGLRAGQRVIPVDTAGCYVPGGRYSHIASAIMTVTTAKVAGCKNIIACSPPRPGVGIAPAIVFAAQICGADRILAMGGVQGVAAMTFGLFGLPPANILVGPGNQFVAEAKRILFGRVGIDMFAGPTDSLILADASADPMVVAADLVGQAEHGYNSPVWLVTDHRPLAEEVLALVPTLIATLPETNRDNATAAWRDYAEVILCADRQEMAATSDEYAPEHLTVQAADLDWWLETLTCYGSLFLGEETTVAFGDKAAGPNHVLPTNRAATYTGGLSVHKYMKIVTWQRATREGCKPVAEATARISRLEGMEGHARTADLRLRKYFPNDVFDLTAEE